MNEDELSYMDYEWYSTYLKQPKYKSTMEIGNIQINNIKHFNFIQKLFWRIFLGIKIKDVKE